MKRTSLCLLLLLVPPAQRLYSADQPQWGQAWSRNLVSTERNLPESFDIGSSRNIKWAVQLGTERKGQVIVEDGLAGGETLVVRPKDDLRDARKSIETLPQARRELESLRSAFTTWQDLQTRIETAREALQLEVKALSGEPATIRREYNQSDSESKALAEQLQAGKKEDAAAQRDARRPTGRFDEAAVSGSIETVSPKRPYSTRACPNSSPLLPP